METSNYLVFGLFYRDNDYNNCLTFGLNPDKSYTPHSWDYPIIWTGHVGWKEVCLIQSTRNDIDFSSLPLEMIHAIEHIEGRIEQAIKKLD